MLLLHATLAFGDEVGPVAVAALEERKDGPFTLSLSGAFGFGVLASPDGILANGGMFAIRVGEELDLGREFALKVGVGGDSVWGKGLASHVYAEVLTAKRRGRTTLYFGARGWNDVYAFDVPVDLQGAGVSGLAAAGGVLGVEFEPARDWTAVFDGDVGYGRWSRVSPPDSLVFMPNIDASFGVTITSPTHILWSAEVHRFADVPATLELRIGHTF